MPNEPDKDDDTINICFRFKISSNCDTSTSKRDTRLYRRFYKCDNAEILVNFVESISSLPYYDEIEIATSYPKTVIYNSTHDHSNNNDKTLMDLNLDSDSIIWVSISIK